MQRRAAQEAPRPFGDADLDARRAIRTVEKRLVESSRTDTARREHEPILDDDAKERPCSSSMRSMPPQRTLTGGIRTTRLLLLVLVRRRLL